MAETVTILRAAYDALLTRIADLEDAVLADRARREGPPLPAAFAWRIAEGENPVRVWREYRGEGLRRLAERAGIAPGFLSEIESGRKSGGVATLKALAAALDTTVDWLIL